jgi:cytochrome b
MLIFGGEVLHYFAMALTIGILFGIYSSVLVASPLVMWLGVSREQFQFIRGPGAIRDYLQGRWQGEGHNPLGALSVLALLATLILLVATGLFANDDIAFEGPLYALVGKELSDRVVGIHRLIEPLIMLLVFAHLAAIVFYTRVKKQDLVKPMVTGWKAGVGEPAKGGGAIAFCIALAIALLAAYGASGAWLPPAVSTPPAASGGNTPAF